MTRRPRRAFTPTPARHSQKVAPPKKRPRPVTTTPQDPVMRRRALVIGVDYYAGLEPLRGCVNDARAVAAALGTNGDGTTNFGHVTLRTASTAKEAVTRADLKDLISDLFAAEGEIALLYFAGHGHVEATGGYLCGSEVTRGDDGLALAEVLALAQASKAENRIIMLDSCHSGVAGNPAGHTAAELSEGVTILTASTVDQYAAENDGCGVFTALLLDALAGAAANLMGDVTPGSVYAHVDQALGPWKQRPVFKTNVKRFVSLRRVPAPIAAEELRLLPRLFPTRGFLFALDPSFEPELRGRPSGAPPPNAANTATFAILQRCNRLHLLKPVGAPHMWHAAIESKSCQLTALGEHYRALVIEHLI
jgi:Caspase domain